MPCARRFAVVAPRVSVAHRPEKLIEDSFAQIGRDAAPFVFDGDYYLLRVVRQTSRDANVCACGRILRRVINERVDDFADSARVNAHQR